MRKFSYKFINSIWYDNLRPPIILKLLSIIFRLIIYVRKSFYDLGIFKVIDTGIPIIVVGNISIGGTGKTPISLWLSDQLSKRNLKVGIISRGYKGKNKRKIPTIINKNHTAIEFGDEAIHLFEESDAMICVCKNKVKAAKLLLKKEVDIIISDDGLQHYALKRDIEIIVIDGMRLFGNKQLLPAGPLREPIERLSSADLLMVNGCESNIEDEYIFTDTPTVFFKLTNDLVKEINGKKTRQITEFSDQNVQVLAGIGNPEKLYSELKKMGLSVLPIETEDHGFIDLRLIKDTKSSPLFITPKDYVKYQGNLPDNTWLLNPKIEIRDKSNIESILKKVFKNEC